MLLDQAQDQDSAQDSNSGLVQDPNQFAQELNLAQDIHQGRTLDGPRLFILVIIFIVIGS